MATSAAPAPQDPLDAVIRADRDLGGLSAELTRRVPGLRRAVRQRERWIDGSVAVTASLLSGGDAEDARVVVAERVRQLAAGEAGIVLLPKADGGLEVAAVDADEPSGLLGTVVPADSPMVSELFAGSPVHADDPAADPRMAAGIFARYGPSMLLPLRSGDRLLGVVCASRRRGDRVFTATERALAGGFAAQAAVALVLAEAQRDREQLAVHLAVQEERDRMARDLHDLVVQRLFATGLALEGAQRRSAEAGVREQVGWAVRELNATIQEVRTTIFALQQDDHDQPDQHDRQDEYDRHDRQDEYDRQDEHDQHDQHDRQDDGQYRPGSAQVSSPAPGAAQASPGLRARVLREIGTAAGVLGFRPSVIFTGPVDSRVGEPAGRDLLAALREALSNAFRHARAGRMQVIVDVTVRLPDGRAAVRLTVADDGVGLPDGGRRSGLTNLARRAEALGGTSSYGRPGLDDRGTTVVWEVPV